MTDSLNGSPRLKECSTILLYAAVPVVYLVLIGAVHWSVLRFLSTSEWWIGIGCGLGLSWAWRQSKTVAGIGGVLGALLLVATASGVVQVQQDGLRAVGLGISVGMGVGMLAMAMVKWPETHQLLCEEAERRGDTASLKYMRMRPPVRRTLGWSVNRKRCSMDSLQAERTALEAASSIMLGSNEPKNDLVIAGSEFNWTRCFQLSVAVIDWERRRGLNLDTKARAKIVAHLYRQQGGPTFPGADEIAEAAA
jgi:hypothetical protein